MFGQQPGESRGVAFGEQPQGERVEVMDGVDGDAGNVVLQRGERERGLAWPGLAAAARCTARRWR
jgi:hypothetical protein